MLVNNFLTTTVGLCTFENINGEFEYIFNNRVNLETADLAPSATISCSCSLWSLQPERHMRSADVLTLKLLWSVSC